MSLCLLLMVYRRAKHAAAIYLRDVVQLAALFVCGALCTPPERGTPPLQGAGMPRRGWQLQAGFPASWHGSRLRLGPPGRGSTTARWSRPANCAVTHNGAFSAALLHLPHHLQARARPPPHGSRQVLQGGGGGCWRQQGHWPTMAAVSMHAAAAHKELQPTAQDLYAQCAAGHSHRRERPAALPAASPARLPPPPPPPLPPAGKSPLSGRAHTFCRCRRITPQTCCKGRWAGQMETRGADPWLIGQ